MKRRDIIRLGLAAGAFICGRRASANATGDAPATDEAPLTPHAATQGSSRPNRVDADYIVVGSGAGGGTVAARLAEAGFTVLLLEAGGDPRTSTGSTPQTPGVNSLPDDYDVPAFHALATENDGMRWDFFVRHYENQKQQELDPHYRATHEGKPVNGVLYPRAGTLGGCTAHNAMILVYPHDADFDQIADVTGDPSWRAGRMRAYFEKIEQCHHRPLERLWSRIGLNPSRHGWSGWLNTEMAIPSAAIRDRDLHGSIMQSVRDAFNDPSLALSDADRRARLESRFDPNDARVVADNAVGLRYTPLTTKNHQRVGTRERVLDVNRRFPALLKIQLHALATRVLFDDQKRAIGVEYQSGERLYGAAPRSSGAPAETRQVFAGREVILAGGAFNTPQLLMLSGIGPRDELARHGITPVRPLDGVGRNLQDRYEVAVVNRMKFPAWEALDGATFTNRDAQYKAWSDGRRGVYKTNGAILSVVARSGPGAPVPDLFLYALLGRFEGYFPGYSSLFAKNPNYLTWVVLKAHTNNTAGRVTLRSRDPRVPPDVNFRYFKEGSHGHAEDAEAVASGIVLARRLTAGLTRRGFIEKEEVPGDAFPDETLAEFSRNHAWGHHASCTCRIGPEDRGGVLSGDFKVHGVQGLRVVDASVFPRIPGYFIVSAVYMIAEKAADAIIADARGKGLAGLVRRLIPSRSHMTSTVRATALVSCLAASGCSLATGIRTNTEAIGKSSAAIDTNTKAISESTTGTQGLIPALQGVERLSGPMQSVAALDPTMRSVAALSEPMSKVAALDPSMRALAELQQPMTRLVAIGPGLDAVANLSGPMSRVADMRGSLESVASLRPSLDQVSQLEPRLAAVADLKSAMQDLAMLRAPLEQVGALTGPMSSLAALTPILQRPILLILIALVALGAWGLVTFLAVKFAIQSAQRRASSTA